MNESYILTEGENGIAYSWQYGVHYDEEYFPVKYIATSLNEDRKKAFFEILQVLVADIFPWNSRERFNINVTLHDSDEAVKN